MSETELIETLEKVMVLRRNRIRKILFRHGMHLGQPEMLNYVLQHPGCTQKQAAENANVTPASVAASFKRMENMQLIDRLTDPADTRCNRVYLSDAGESALKECLTEIEKLDTVMLSGINEKSIQAILIAANQIINNLKEDQ